MLTNYYPEYSDSLQSDDDLPKKLPATKPGKINTKVIALSFLMCGSLAIYSYTAQPPKVVQLADDQPTNYTKTVDNLADNYLQIANYSVKQSGNKCYKTSVSDCLEMLTPDPPKYLQGSNPNDAIKYQLRLLVYQTRTDAIKLAKQRSQNTK